MSNHSNSNQRSSHMPVPYQENQMNRAPMHPDSYQAMTQPAPMPPGRYGSANPMGQHNNQFRVEVSFPGSEVAHYPQQSYGGPQSFNYAHTQHHYQNQQGGYSRNAHSHDGYHQYGYSHQGGGYGDPVRILIGEAGNEEAVRNAVASGAEEVVLVFEPAIAERILRAIREHVTPWALSQGVSLPVSRPMDGGISIGLVVMVLGIVALVAIVATIRILTDAGYDADIDFNAPWFNDQPWGLEIRFRRPSR